MSSARIRLRVPPVRDIESYIRHVRMETMKAIRMKPDPAFIEPIPNAVYVVAHDESTDEPVALAEAAFVSKVYERYEDLPYGGVVDLRRFCPLDRLASVRTIYVEPAYRGRHALYSKLLAEQTRIFAALGAEWALATTPAQNARLQKLYEGTGGKKLGTFLHEAVSGPVSLFIFSVDELLRHPLLRQVRSLESSPRSDARQSASSARISSFSAELKLAR